MPGIVHLQYDELPVHDLDLEFDTPPATWPALNATDKITLVVTSDTGTNRTVALTRVTFDPTGMSAEEIGRRGRRVRWSPAAPLNAVVTSTDTCRARVTQTDGKSYSHPGPADPPWTFRIVGVSGGVDVTDPV